MTSRQDDIDRLTSTFERGDPIGVHPLTALRVLRDCRLRSASRRGYVIAFGALLVRVTAARGAWLVQKLPQPSWVALEPEHVHSVHPVTLPDGWDVLVRGVRHGMVTGSLLFFL